MSVTTVIALNAILDLAIIGLLATVMLIPTPIGAGRPQLQTARG